MTTLDISTPVGDAVAERARQVDDSFARYSEAVNGAFARRAQIRADYAAKQAAKRAMEDEAARTNSRSGILGS